jgi:sec-independent protein translocase protein TatC
MIEDLRPHLVELRKRLTISVISFLVVFLVSFAYSQPLLEWVTQPLHDALVSVAKISPLAAKGMMTTNQVGGAFFMAMKVSFFASIVVSLPIILSQIWLFVAPGLYENEKKMLLPFVFGGSFMFAVGVAFAYYVVTPFGFTFLITFGSETFTPLINIEDYVGFFTKIMFGFGIAFELPIFAYFLALLGLITDRTLIDFFRYAVVIIFILAAILTPPDVLTQLLMAIPLIILYGISILIVKYVNPAPKEEKELKEEPEGE